MSLRLPEPFGRPRFTRFPYKPPIAKARLAAATRPSVSVTRLPNNYTPHIPEFFPGMIAARNRGQEIYLIQRPDPEDPKHRQTIGYMTGYERIDAYRITYLYIVPCFRRQGFGAAALRKVQENQGFVSCTVPERNLAAQLLLKQTGFRCLKTIFDPKLPEDADGWYFFQWENPITRQLDITPPNFDLLPEAGEVVSDNLPDVDDQGERINDDGY